MLKIQDDETVTDVSSLLKESNVYDLVKQILIGLNKKEENLF